MMEGILNTVQANALPRFSFQALEITFVFFHVPSSICQFVVKNAVFLTEIERIVSV